MINYTKGIKFLVFSLFFAAIPLASQAGNNFKIDYHPLAFTDKVSLVTSLNSEQFLIPWQWEALTPAYEYSFITPGFYDPSRPMDVKIYYPEKSNRLKQIFSFDFLSSVWRPVPTVDNTEEQYLSMQTDATSAWLIALAQPDVMSTGKASWYKYKEGLFAASPDYPKGTKLRVYNINNGKSVDVTVNDYGPDRSIHPDRVIDLDRVAFEKIAPLSAGVVSVKVEVISELSEKPSPVSLVSAYPEITARNAIIMMEDSGEIIWEKDADKAVPIASLTKLMSIYTFLSTRPDMSRVVSYKKQDELYNYEHCYPWESARLQVSEGETMTIEDLIYSTLVGSANNSIETLVRVSGLSRADFIKKMNEFAKLWGAYNTNFVEPSGLAPANVSSPKDYAIITKEIFKNPLMEKISTTSNYSFSTINTKDPHNLKNTNPMLKEGEYEIIGSKTGYLHESLYCLMTRIKTAKGNMIVINLGSDSKDSRTSDNKQLIDYGLKALNK
ncbi:MAG: RlpA-like double-psi beta-barrel domain-containing protein [Patescibacteria group bacterium]|nr:RlpA-like double-psi beta-barrel domain-containing protein [Patescibacteria group bacterium]